MKKILNTKTNLLAMFLVLLIVGSCEDDSEVFTVTETTPVILSELDISTIELDANNTTNPAVTFHWTSADYGQPAAENYNLEIASDESFSNPVAVASTTGITEVTLTVGELNSAVGNAGLAPFEWNMAYARVISSLGSQNGLPVSSNIIGFNVLPYYNYPFKDYYLVGSGTAPGWNNNSNNPALFRDPNNSQVFYYRAYFNKASSDAGEGRFKVLETKGLWQPQWGTAYPDGSDPIETGGEIAGNPGTQSADPGRFGVLTSGYYTFMIDFGAKQYTIEPLDASGATDYTSITVQGSALASDVSLTQSTFDSHMWYSNATTLSVGDLQFVTNLGSSWGSTTGFSGQATEDGGSIPVIVGDDYDIWFNDLTGDYILIPLNL